MSKKKIVNPPRSLKRMFPNLKTVIDAKVPITVHVKGSDCKNAIPLDINECAMAKAAKREFKVDAVIIGLATSYLIKGNKATRFKTPAAVQREIVSFDRHSDFEPGEYHLTTYSPTLKLGTNHRRKNHKGGKNKNAKRIYHRTAKIRTFSE